MTQHLAQADEYDPRQELIPNASPLEGNDLSGQTSDLSVGPDFFGAFGGWWANLFDGSAFGWLAFLGGIGAFLSWLWSIYTVLAYLFCALCVGLYIYATIRQAQFGALLTQRVRNAEELWNQLYRSQGRPSRLDDIRTHVSSGNPNDWKLAIIEADVMLDQTLIANGYPGATLGERLKGTTVQQLSTLNDAWDVHRIRNQIAHEGADFVLTQRAAQQAIMQYERVLAELGVT